MIDNITKNNVRSNFNDLFWEIHFKHVLLQFKEKLNS